MIARLLCWLGFHDVRWHKIDVVHGEQRIVGAWSCVRSGCAYRQQIKVPLKAGARK